MKNSIKFALVGVLTIGGGVGIALAKDGHGARMFERIDTDGDGAVTAEEIEARVRERAADRARRRFERLDADGDGVVERSEFEARAAARFQRMDADGDGSVTKEEIRARRDRRGG